MCWRREGREGKKGRGEEGGGDRTSSLPVPVQGETDTNRVGGTRHSQESVAQGGQGPWSPFSLSLAPDVQDPTLQKTV